MLPSEKIRGLVCGLVAVVWAASIGAGMFVPGYHADPGINAAFAAMLVFLFRDKDDDEDEGGEDG